MNGELVGLWHHTCLLRRELPVGRLEAEGGNVGDNIQRRPEGSPYAAHVYGEYY
jgi:hypothetical protein